MDYVKAKLSQGLRHANKQMTHKKMKVASAAEGRKFAYQMCLHWITEMERKNGN